MKIYFFSYHCQPTLTNVNSNNIGGAYVNCWIKANSFEDADKISREKIKKDNWIILTLEEADEVNWTNYIEENEGKKYFEQALIDGWVLVFHTYPND